MTHHVTSGRASIAVDDTGASDGPPVLMLHAGVTDRRSWAPLVDHLGTHVRSIRYDQRGYGDTDYEAEDGWSPVADAIAVMDAADVPSAIVVGGSMGGGTAIDLALQHPHRVDALVLISPAVNGAPEPQLEESATELDREIDAADERGDLDTVNQLETHLWLDGPGHDDRVGGSARELFLEMNGRALTAPETGEPTEPPDAWAQLARLAMPALFLAGDLDLRHFRTDARAAAASVQHGRFVELRDTAHVPQVEEHAQTLRVITGFITTLS